MKKLILLFSLIPTLILSQEKKDYVRSSLHLHLVDDFEFENGDKVLNSYNKFEFPQNYNDHTIDLNKIKLSDFDLTDEEKAEAGVKNDVVGDLLKSSIQEATGGLIKIQDNSFVKLQLEKYISSEKIAHRLVKKWWMIGDDGSFDRGLVTERSLQSKTMEMAAIASASGTGEVDQFNKLINNTFVVFTRLYFVSNEIWAEIIRQQAYAVADGLGGGLPTELARKAADKLYQKQSEGYSVWTTAWLYQLEWDINVFDMFVTTITDGKIDLEKFDSLDFKLNFLGMDKATSLVSGFSSKEENQSIFDLATVRNVDKVLVKLQREYDVFKPIFPLRENFSVAAGVKEGIEGGETFEVLETKNGEYNRIGTMKVDKKKVWDNSWTGEEIEPGLTYFKKGNKKFVPGIHYVRLKNK